MPVLLYEGEQDFICNKCGQKKFLKYFMKNSTDYGRRRHLQDYPVTPFISWAHRLGYYRRIEQKDVTNSLIFVQVFQAGHLVPYDRPAVAAMTVELLLDEQQRSYPPTNTK